MLVQAESVQKFLEPCTIWVIVNETSLDGWHELLAPYYTRCTFNLVLAPVLDNADGWWRQQYYKLWAHTLVKDSYLLLDSKNFFVKPCSTSAWDNQLGAGIYEDYSVKGDRWLRTIHEYAEYLGVEPSSTHLAMQTPFVIDYRVMQSSNLDQLLAQFEKFTAMPSEFILYSMLAEKHQHTGKLQLQHVTVWPMYAPSIWPAAIKCIAEPQILVAGLHRTFLDRMDKSVVNCWLASLGFTHGVD